MEGFIELGDDLTFFLLGSVTRDFTPPKGYCDTLELGDGGANFLMLQNYLSHKEKKHKLRKYVIEIIN